MYTSKAECQLFRVHRLSMKKRSAVAHPVAWNQRSISYGSHPSALISLRDAQNYAVGDLVR